jgi:hypothetical protein
MIDLAMFDRDREADADVAAAVAARQDRRC